jgi:tetratricopeptide (TPR) repeat protein
LFLIAGSLVFFACATKPDVYRDIDVNINAEAYDQALSIIAAGQESKKPVYPKKNLIMYYLDKGVVEHYAGKYKESAEDFEEAEHLIEEAYTKSISAETASFVANDNTKDYAGEDYEDLYTNVFNALNYYHNGNVEGAGVEVRQISEKLTRLEDKYSGDGNKVKEALAGTINLLGGQTIELPSTTPVQISDTALGRYLSAIIYRSLGQIDSARIDIEAIGAAYAKTPTVYTNPVPGWINDELTVPSDQARLNILAFAGLSPVKEEEIVVLPSIFQYATYTGPYLSSLEKSKGVVW